MVSTDGGRKTKYVVNILKTEYLESKDICIFAGWNVDHQILSSQVHYCDI